MKKMKPPVAKETNVEIKEDALTETTATTCSREQGESALNARSNRSFYSTKKRNAVRPKKQTQKG